MTLLCLLAGKVINLEGWSAEIFIHGINVLAVTALLEIIIVSPAALLAVISRGFLLPIGFAILALLIANFTGALGFSEYFPWAIPLLYQSEGAIGAVSWIILFLTGIAGAAGTFAWWRFADQH